MTWKRQMSSRNTWCGRCAEMAVVHRCGIVKSIALGKGLRRSDSLFNLSSASAEVTPKVAPCPRSFQQVLKASIVTSLYFQTSPLIISYHPSTRYRPFMFITSSTQSTQYSFADPYTSSSSGPRHARNLGASAQTTSSGFVSRNSTSFPTRII